MGFIRFLTVFIVLIFVGMFSWGAWDVVRVSHSDQAAAMGADSSIEISISGSGVAVKAARLVPGAMAMLFGFVGIVLVVIRVPLHQAMDVREQVVVRARRSGKLTLENDVSEVSPMPCPPRAFDMDSIDMPPQELMSPCDEFGGGGGGGGGVEDGRDSNGKRPAFSLRILSKPQKYPLLFVLFYRLIEKFKKEPL